jgi:hypothetical protein
MPRYRPPQTTAFCIGGLLLGLSHSPAALEPSVCVTSRLCLAPIYLLNYFHDPILSMRKFFFHVFVVIPV